MNMNKSRILLIEDDKIDQMAFERFVKRENLPYEYTLAKSLKDARNILTTERFDVIITDHFLGDGTAFDIINTIKDTPVIFTTGAGNEEIAVKAMKAGAFDYLTKDQDQNHLHVMPVTIENAIRHSQMGERLRKLSSAVEQSPSIVVITDIQNNIEYVNPTFTRVTGFTAEEVIGARTNILKSGKHPPEFYKQLWKTITSKGEWHGELHNKKKNGELYWESASLSIIRNQKGAITSFIKVAEDITQRKKMEEQIRESEEKYRKMFELSPEAIILLDNKGNLLDVNQKLNEWLGYQSEEIMGKNLLQLPYLTAKSKFKAMRNFLKRMLGKEIPPYELIFTTKNGEQKTGIVVASPIKDNQGKTTYDLVMISDITERKKDEEKLKEALNIKSKFTSMVSHELRTPLTAIKEGIGIVLEGDAGNINTDQEDFLQTAKRNVDRLHRLINDVLDFTKLESGRAEFRMEENDINKTIQEIVETFQYVIKEKGLYLKTELTPDIEKAHYDADRISQVLINLVNNAVKFTEKGGITIQTRKNEEENIIQITVRDTGLGVKQEDIPKLFHEFQQVNQGKYRKPGSTGLGLAICKEIVEKHQGKISVESKERSGSAFGFTLPLNRNKNNPKKQEVEHVS
jgi:PAS domain S-box-containing protein